MGKDFLKLRSDQKKLCVIILLAGLIITCALGITAYQDTKLLNDNELPKNEAGEDSYEQDIIAWIDDKRIPVTVTVEERKFTREEAEAELEKAGKLLDDSLKGMNESLEKISESIHFVDIVPETAVEVEWVLKPTEYFYSDGTLREDVEISEPVELKISAILNCQEYTKDYETMITLLPKKIADEKKLLRLIEESVENDEESSVINLPKEYENKTVVWRKPLDTTFLYFFFLTLCAVVFLVIGSKKDEQTRKQERLEEVEKDYAQIVSKFTMLLSAGLSVRNAWERIVLLYRGKPEAESPIMAEMNWGYREMQKGVSELEVYEKFGLRVGHIHYKKLMALFISDKRRGSVNLLEAMNQEMLQAWEEQKRKTKQQGEKIGTKLMVPMMGMLAVVFIMILVPAFLSFQL